MALHHSYIQTIAALLQVNIVIIVQTIAHHKRRTNELMNLLASVSVTSSQKWATKMRKKRKPKRFWTSPWRTFFLRSRTVCNCDFFFSLFFVFGAFFLAMRKRRIKLLCDVLTIVFANRNDIAPASCKRDSKNHTPAWFDTGVISSRRRTGIV